MAIIPPDGYKVFYTRNGERQEYICLTKNSALDYITRMHLTDAVYKPLYLLEHCETTVEQAKDVPSSPNSNHNE